ncbi:MAG: hypothetical protein WD708_05005 [Kiritimatiellia bacterium]
MKKFKTCSLLVLALVGFSSAHAQSIGAYASYFNADDLENVYGGGALLQVPVSQNLYVILRVAHYPGSEYSSRLGPLEVPVFADVDFTPIDIGLGLQGALGNSTTVVYADAGFTYLMADGTFMVNEFTSDAKFEDENGWYGALGVRSGEKTQGFLEVQFRSSKADISSEESSQINDYMKEIDLDHLAVNLGVRFSW